MLVGWGLGLPSHDPRWRNKRGREKFPTCLMDGRTSCSQLSKGLLASYWQVQFDVLPLTLSWAMWLALILADVMWLEVWKALVPLGLPLSSAIISMRAHPASRPSQEEGEKSLGPLTTYHE